MRLVAVAALAALPTAALAQETGGLNAHGFVVSAQDGDIRDHTVMHRPGTLTPGGFFVGGLFEYANRPLVLVTEGDDGDTTSAALTDVVALNLTGGVSPIDRLRIAVSAPLVLTSSSFGDSQGFALGDVRLDVMGLLVDPANADGLGVAVVPWVDLPTGATDKWLGRRTVAFGGVVAGTYEGPAVTLTSNLGVQAEPSVEVSNQTGGFGLVASAGGNWIIDDSSSLGLEATLRAPFSTNRRAYTGRPSEAIVSYRRSTSAGVWLNAGLAVPLTPGAGAAAFRVFVGGGFGKTSPPAPRDRDNDGLLDADDACPTEPETPNGHQDDDGCPDELAGLVVRVTHGGEPVTGAILSVEGPIGGGTHDLGAASTWHTPVQAGQTFGLRATKGCLSGSARTQVAGEGEETLDLAMTPTLDATAQVWVHDADGQPLPEASLSWDTDSPACVSTAAQLGTDGKVDIPIGEGMHKLVVTSPGFRVVEVPVIASPGDLLPVEVTLTESRITMTPGQIIILDKVEFDSGTSTIKAASYPILDEVALVIRRNPQIGRIEVQGHTDDQGADDANMRLSQARAEAVMAYLVKKGVPAERLSAKGYGEERPLTRNATPAGRAANRRVEFTILGE